MLETQSKVIGSTTYKVTQLGAVQGRKVLTRVLRTVGPAFDGLGAGSETKAIGALLEHLKEDDVDYLCDVFAGKTCLVIGSKEPLLSDVFDIHFAARYGDMVSWLVFCFEVNYSSFFGEMAKGAFLPRAADKPSDSPKA